jgi:thioredoxin-like negative regulator of GroEL
MPGVLATFRAMTSPAIHIITHDSFAAMVGKPGYCILDCSATWCPPCQRFAPVFAAAAERRRDLTWGAIDTEQEPQLAAALDIRAQPTIVVLRDGAVIYKHVGALSAAKFDELIDRVTRA